MRRRIVFSIDQALSEPPEAARLVCSEGMKMASSFASRFQIMGLIPWAEVFTSGTPVENGYLYCNSPARRELLDAINKASLIAVKLKYGKADLWDGEDQRAIICEISFRRSKITFQVNSFFFLLEDGECVQSGTRHRDGEEEVFLSPLDQIEDN